MQNDINAALFSRRFAPLETGQRLHRFALTKFEQRGARSALYPYAFDSSNHPNMDNGLIFGEHLLVE